MKFKLTAVFLILSLVLFGAVPSTLAEKASAETNSHPKVMDIGPKLRKQAEDEDFQRQLKQQLKEQAEKIQADEESGSNGSGNGDAATYGEGTVKYFLGYDTVNGYYVKQYTLREIGENVEVWVANDLSWKSGDDRPVPKITQEQISALVQEFDTNIYPKETEFFGQPDPLTGEHALLDNLLGLPEDYYVAKDGDSRVMLLIDNFRDANYYDPEYPFYVAGFFSPTYETYFDRNIVNIDAYNLASSTESAYGTLAHEFQHLIHSDNDGDEVTWLNEGMSDLAEYLVGYGHPMGHVNFFLNHPENSLVAWDEYIDSPTGPETLADYGQAYLLELYLLDHYGETFIRDLAKDTKNGIASVNDVLDQVNAGIDFGQLFRNFSLALTIDSPQPGNGVYNFESIDVQVDYRSAENTDKQGVPAWGADYIELNPGNKIRQITFDGIKFMPVQWEVVQDPLESGHGQVLWGNNGNLVDNQLIFEADLSKVDSATLTFDHYYDIENKWDYGMVQVSTDGGKTWTSLSNEHTTDAISANGHPDIKKNLPGFTGTNGGWTSETFDLSPYAGQKVLVSFRYMTDWATNASGWYVDNIEIPEIGFQNDGSSLGDFHSIDEIKGRYVNYAVSFVHEKNSGHGDITQVLNIEPFNVTEAESQTLEKFLSGGDTYMIVWYAAPIGQRNPADYSYNILTNGDLHKHKH